MLLLRQRRLRHDTCDPTSPPYYGGCSTLTSSADGTTIRRVAPSTTFTRKVGLCPLCEAFLFLLGTTSTSTLLPHSRWWCLTTSSYYIATPTVPKSTSWEATRSRRVSGGAAASRLPVGAVTTSSRFLPSGSVLLLSSMWGWRRPPLLSQPHEITPNLKIKVHGSRRVRNGRCRWRGVGWISSFALFFPE